MSISEKGEHNHNHHSNDFVHLHVHTEHSTLDGINRIETLPKIAKDLGMSACAITDHGVVSGTYAFHKSCVANGIKPILGMEAYYAIDRTVKGPDENGERYYHLVLLAQNDVGLHNLFRISSDSFQNGMYYKPRTDARFLAEHSEGLFATSACLGSHTSQLIMRGEIAKAKAVLESHAELFPDRFFIELQSHKGDQQAVNEVLLKMADELNLPTIYTADCHYTHAEDKRLHEITLAMQTNQTMSDPKRFTFGDIDVHFCKPETAKANCKEFRIPNSALRNTVSIAEAIDSDRYFYGYHNRYPIFHTDEKPWMLLERLSITALDQKFPDRPKIYVERLQKELKVIKAMGFYDYFLVMSDFLNQAKTQGIITGPGRGSVAGCLVAYLLGITQVDPIKYDLLFERFLTEGRGATPKIF